MTTTPALSHSPLPALLEQLEAELRKQQLWNAVAPSEQALASTTPFMYDTLKLHEWLQWVFLPRLRALLEAEGQLAFQCNIHPLAEHEWEKATEFDKRELLALLARLDRALNDGGLTPAEQADERPDQLH